MKKFMIILADFAICGSMAAQDCKHLYKEQKPLNKTTQKERMEKERKDAPERREEIHKTRLASNARQIVVGKAVR